MSRANAIARAIRAFESGQFLETLARRVAIETESKSVEGPDWARLNTYLDDEIALCLVDMGFSRIEILRNEDENWPFLLATREEGPSYPTALLYGHGDVVAGEEEKWTKGTPWKITTGVGDDHDKIYGRGTADNKGQHTVLLTALKSVIEERGGSLGWNAIFLMEMGEEAGSPGISSFCEQHKDDLAADVFIACDGPRVAVESPTLFLGTRGGMNFELRVQLRESGEFHHSGTFGGLLKNPAIRLIHALSTLTDANGEIQIEQWKPKEIPESIRDALTDCPLDVGEDGPEIDPLWGEPGLSPVEKAFAWNSFEILGLECAKTPPDNAIPPSAIAYLQLRFVAGCDEHSFLPALEDHLKANGFNDVTVERRETAYWKATRNLPDHPWVQWAADSIEQTTNKKPTILPNLAGSLPIAPFSEVLGLPVLFVPHSYPSCGQHSINEHALSSLLVEGLSIMAGLFWDLGDGQTPLPRDTM
jgi:acetylornithine deacetylase/succinyl-diaminopimelate desuccinylase-like protein